MIQPDVTAKAGAGCDEFNHESGIPESDQISPSPYLVLLITTRAYHRQPVQLDTGLIVVTKGVHNRLRRGSQ